MKRQISNMDKITKNKADDNEISNVNLEEDIQLENLNKDIQDVINKYAKNRLNVSSYGETPDSKKGFFLMWVKKDLDAPENEKVQITIFAQFINTDEVISSMTKVLSDMAEEQKKPIGIA